jgi:3-deoxy-D-manno-octulosonic-acid transferase
MRLTGDCKLDQPVRLLTSEEVEKLREELALSRDDRVFLAGSTHAGEETLIVDAWWQIRLKQPNTRLVIAPRHTDRIPEIEQALSSRGFHTVRRSELLARNGNGHLTGCEVILIDTIGELVRLYAVADITFVGGSLIKRGGHNVLEPAIQGKPVLFGPSIANFRDSARLLLDTGVGWRVQSTDDICRISDELLKGDERLFEIRHRALSVLEKNRGAAGATVEIVLELLGLTPPHPASAGPEEYSDRPIHLS